MEPQTWHHGLVARWWAEFMTEGPEIAYFRRFINDAGQPALDAACGTGRLLVPFLDAGLDVDGCDISADMIGLCRERAENAGHSPNLYVQALHELDLPRHYRTIVVCGGFGLGGERSQDQLALERLRDHLEPGGTLVLDNEVPYNYTGDWPFWLASKRKELPEDFGEPRPRRMGSDGAEYGLRSRLIDLDPLNQRATYEMRAEKWLDGTLIEEEKHLLKLTMYFKDELVLMLEKAGFSEISVRGGYADAEPTPDHDFLVFVAHR